MKVNIDTGNHISIIGPDEKSTRIPPNSGRKIEFKIEQTSNSHPPLRDSIDLSIELKQFGVYKEIDDPSIDRKLS